MNYIKRDIEGVIRELMKKYPCILVVGSHNVGKKTMMGTLYEEKITHYQLHKIKQRSLVSNDPSKIVQLDNLPILISDIQLLPELLPRIKEAIDNGARPGSFLLNGLPSTELVEQATELLGEHIVTLYMHGLSQRESFYRIEGKREPFCIDGNVIAARLGGKMVSNETIYERIWKGSLPALAAIDIKRSTGLHRHMQTYIERHINATVSLSDQVLFWRFICVAARHVGKVLEVHALAQEVAISDSTAKRWLQVMENTGLIFYVKPYSDTNLKRTTTKPKMYFFDTGLATYLADVKNSELLSGEIGEAITENYVVSEIMKSYWNNGKEAKLWYYRDRRGHDIDLIIESNGELQPIEVECSEDPDEALIEKFAVLDKGSVPRGNGAILCFAQTPKRIDERNATIPIWMI